MKTKELKEELIELLYTIYPKRIPYDRVAMGSDMDAVMKFVEKNRLQHFMFCKITDWEEERERYISEYENYQKKIKNSIRVVKDLYDFNEFMVVKTFMGFPQITSDIDILVRSMDDGKFPVHIKKQGLWPIQIENKISWLGAEAVSYDFVWDNTRCYNYKGEEFLVPNVQLDLQIRLAHFIFEEGKIRLPELLYIFNRLNKFDWHVFQQEAEKTNWINSFYRLKIMIESLYACLFECDRSERQIKFPYPVSYLLLAKLVIEKRAWNKIWGARYVLKERLLG